MALPVLYTLLESLLMNVTCNGLIYHKSEHFQMFDKERELKHQISWFLISLDTIPNSMFGYQCSEDTAAGLAG